MKLAYFTDSTFPAISGITNSILNTSGALASHGHKLLIVAPKSKKALSLRVGNKNITVVHVPSLPAVFNPNLRISSPFSPKIYEMVRKFNPDVVHFHTSFLLGLSTILLGHTLNKPIVGTFHSYFMESDYLKTIGAEGAAGHITDFLWKYAALFFNQCDGIIVPTEFVARDLRRHDIKRPIQAISNPINEGMIKLLPSSKLKTFKEKYKLRKKVVLYVGRISEEKNLKVLVHAFSKVVKRRGDVSLFIVGYGTSSAESKLKSMVNHLGLEDSVSYEGAVSQEELFGGGYYQVGTVFASSSASETQGMTFIEAMAYGLPIVASNKRGALDTVEGVGLVSSPSDAAAFSKNLSRVLDDRSLHKKLSIQSKKTFEAKYQRETIVAQYEGFYQKVINSHK